VRRMVPVLVTAITLIGSSVTYSAGFDCTQAQTSIEKAICADQKLNDLDKQMADQYDSLQKTIADSDRTLLTAEQRYWVSERDRNWQGNTGKLKQWYKNRIADLELKARILAGSTPYFGIYISPHDVWISNDNERETMQVTDYFSFTRVKDDSTVLGFQIKSSCPNYHTCELSGSATLNNSRYEYRDIADTDACRLLMTPRSDGMLIETSTMNYCKGYCGETCSFDLTHVVLRKIQAVSEGSDIK